MLKIGDFSKLSHLTVKTLRFYEKEGILVPETVDEWTGYRFYETSQLEEASKIKSYRQLGMTIEDIKSIQSGADMKEILASKAEMLRNQREDIDVRLSIIHHILEENDMKYYLPGHYVSGTTVQMKLYHSDKKNRYGHVFYSDERASAERTKYMERLNRQKVSLDKHIDSKTAQKKDLSGYGNHFYLKYDNNGYLQSYSEKKSAIQKEADGFGYFVIVTSKKMTAEEALVKYRSRDYAEKLNMIFKSELGLYTFRVQSEVSMKSKLFLGFIAMIVRNEMYQKLKELSQKEKDRKNYTVPSALHNMERFFLMRIEDNYCQMYALTKKQKLILDAFGIDKKYIESFINRTNKALQKRM